MADTYALAQIKSGNILEGITYPLTQLMGYWWVSLLLAAFCGTIYIRTGESRTPLIIMLVSSLTLWQSLPAEAFTATAPLVAIGFAGLLFSFYGSQK